MPTTPIKRAIVDAPVPPTCTPLFADAEGLADELVREEDADDRIEADADDKDEDADDEMDEEMDDAIDDALDMDESSDDSDDAEALRPGVADSTAAPLLKVTLAMPPTVSLVALAGEEGDPGIGGRSGLPDWIGSAVAVKMGPPRGAAGAAAASGESACATIWIGLHCCAHQRS